MSSKWSTLCIARGFVYFERKQKCCDRKIPVWGRNGLLMLVKRETGLISSFIPSVFPLFPLPVSLSVSLSPFPVHLSLPPRLQDRRQRGVDSKGDDPLLSLSPSLSPSLALSLCLALSALQSPLSTLITYINVSKKKTALWICLCVCVCARYRERESVWACLCVCVCVCVCARAAQTQVNNQTELWLLGCCITTNGFLVRQTREEQAFSACLPWTMALRWREEEKESDEVCVCVCLFSGHGGRDERSRGGGMDRKMDMDR